MQCIEKRVGAKIQEIRKAKGITQDQLALKAGLDRVHLYRIENGKQSMTLKTLELIAQTLAVTEAELLQK